MSQVGFCVHHGSASASPHTRSCRICPPSQPPHHAPPPSHPGFLSGLRWEYRRSKNVITRSDRGYFSSPLFPSPFELTPHFCYARRCKFLQSVEWGHCSASRCLVARRRGLAPVLRLGVGAPTHTGCCSCESRVYRKMSRNGSGGGPARSNSRKFYEAADPDEVQQGTHPHLLSRDNSTLWPDQNSPSNCVLGHAAARPPASPCTAVCPVNVGVHWGGWRGAVLLGFVTGDITHLQKPWQRRGCLALLRGRAPPSYDVAGTSPLSLTPRCRPARRRSLHHVAGRHTDIHARVVGSTRRTVRSLAAKCVASPVDRRSSIAPHLIVPPTTAPSRLQRLPPSAPSNQHARRLHAVHPWFCTSVFPPPKLWLCCGQYARA